MIGGNVRSEGAWDMGASSLCLRALTMVVVGLLVPATAPVRAASGPDTAVVPDPKATPCDRQCLEAIVDGYFDALVAHDPAKLRLAPDARYTENGVGMPFGDALWKTANGRGKYRLYVADPLTGEIGFFGTVLENDAPALLSLRLRVDHLRRISEAETLVARPTAGSTLGNAGQAMETRGTPRPQLTRTVPPAQRLSREALTSVADSYFTNLQGSVGKTAAPFRESCNRIENGTQTTNLPTRRPGREGFDVLMLGCEAQQRSGFYTFVTSIRNRRFPIVDQERGLVMAFGYFEHTGAVKDLHLTNGDTVASPVKAPLTLQIVELFQIDGGRIDQVEAVLTTVPFGMRSDYWDR